MGNRGERGQLSEGSVSDNSSIYIIGNLSIL